MIRNKDVIVEIGLHQLTLEDIKERAKAAGMDGRVYVNTAEGRAYGWDKDGNDRVLDLLKH